MGLSDLPTLADRQATRCAQPKYEIPTRLEEKSADDRDEKKLEAACRKAVWTRDKGLCRVCGVKVLKSLELQPKRGETHHIVGRADRAVRFDARNRLLLCATDHQRIERNELFVIGTARQMFTAENGKKYLDADKTLTFSAKRPQ